MAWPEENWFAPVKRFRERLGTQGAGITVGIWDDGLLHFRKGFDAQGNPIVTSTGQDIFSGRMSGKNYMGPANPSGFDASPGSAHGSEIARIIGADRDHWGIAPECQLVTLKAAVDQLRYEVLPFTGDPLLYPSLDLVNVSYAIDHAEPRTAVTQQCIDDMRSGFDGSKLIIASVGNFTPATRSPKLTSPVCLPNVVGVNATVGWSNDLHRLSTKSDWVDVCAPGGDIASYFGNAPLEGTSYACAIVTGICCLVMSYRKMRGLDHSPAEMHSMLRKACRPGSDEKLFGAGPLDLDRLSECVDLTTTRS